MSNSANKKVSKRTPFHDQQPGGKDGAKKSAVKKRVAPSYAHLEDSGYSDHDDEWHAIPDSPNMEQFDIGPRRGLTDETATAGQEHLPPSSNESANRSLERQPSPSRGADVDSGEDDHNDFYRDSEPPGRPFSPPPIREDGSAEQDKEDRPSYRPLFSDGRGDRDADKINKPDIALRKTLTKRLGLTTVIPSI